MRVLPFVLLALLVGLAWWLLRPEEPAGAPVPPEDGAGWVDGLPGLYGVARSEEGAVDLGAIGYAAGSEPPPPRAGVTVHDPERATPGPRLLTSGHAAEAWLLAPDGEVLHRWARPYGELPGAPPLESVKQAPWRRVALLADGGIVAVHSGRALVRLTRDSEVVWVAPVRAHHDLAVAPDGRLLALTREARVVERVDPDAEVVDDRVATLAPDGTLLDELSLWDALAASDWAHLIDELTVRSGDVMHANTLELLDGRIAEQHPAYAAGNVLVCLRNLDLIGVVDLEARRFVHVLGGPWRGPHHPTVTPEGHVLVFDNIGNAGHSRLVEVDPTTGDRRWSWAPARPSDFSTLFCGTADRLASGNLLVAESCRGRAFELAPDGEIVWEWLSPHRAGAHGEFVAALFFVEHVPPERLGWLDD